jgi:hypothetical protein
MADDLHLQRPGLRGVAETRFGLAGEQLPGGAVADGALESQRRVVAERARPDGGRV